MMIQQEMVASAIMWWKKNAWRGKRKFLKEGNDEKIVTIEENK